MPANSGEEQTVTVPTNVGQGTSINFTELGVQVELNNQYDGSVVIGQETVDQAQAALDDANVALAQAQAVFLGEMPFDPRLSRIKTDSFDAQAALDDAQTYLGPMTTLYQSQWR